ncbi:hypothetical protein PCASD_19544 [Puccinia coronata f. sp. avenae]|uniref:JmjC domain-containing protein n=1 Tax=Puccinia coronata f. sp. avenae TaxID=200324 RepID=A0A2N5SMP1_9BASI|nr:hypothetical protein PCASD_19544 [Puccinia coronata f. sp. avenae]
MFRIAARFNTRDSNNKQPHHARREHSQLTRHPAHTHVGRMTIEWQLTEFWARLHGLCDLQECDATIQYQLTTVSRRLLDVFGSGARVSEEEAGRACDEAVATAEGLLVLADEKMSAYPYKDVPTHWRQLHTDATLLKVSALVALDANRRRDDDDAVQWKETVRLLDMALIVSGAPGRGRRGVIFFLLRSIQDKHLAPSGRAASQDADERPEKRQKTGSPDPRSEASSSPAVAPPTVVHPIPEVRESPTITEFVASKHTAPFVIRGYCQHWKALTSRSWARLAYLKGAGGPGRVVPVEVGKTYTEEDWSQTIMSWDDFLDEMSRDPSPRDHRLLYLAQYNLFNQFPSLKDDIQLPEYVYCGDQLPPHDRPRPQAEDAVILNVWLGPAGTVSPAHVDPYYNCYAQIVGRKQVWLADSRFSGEMYPFGTPPAGTGTVTGTCTGTGTGTGTGAEEEEDGERAMSLQAHYMTNTSQVDVFSSLEPHRLPDLRARFPSFVHHVVPAALQTILEPGDMLVLPPGWWHSMKSLEPSINLSMWF